MPALERTSPADTAREPRGPLALTALAVFALLLFAGFVALGTWQVDRRAWKLALIARVDSRVHAPAVDVPAIDTSRPAAWPRINAAADEYRHVRLTGVFLHNRQTLVWASTSLGNGYWVMTPLRRTDGSVVLVNRGFVPPDWCGRNAGCAPSPIGTTTITGLLRLPETHAFLRRNDPAHGRWYTRHVQAIASARGLTHVAPYFIDADFVDADFDAAADGSAPRGGMTVITFPNNHLAYLITWYLLALLTALAAGYVARDEYRLRCTMWKGDNDEV